MADPHWSSLVGIVTGGIGSLTGIAGFILGFISYRRSNKLKSLDIRVKLKKLVIDSHTDHTKLVDMVENGNKSRKAVASMIGQLKSGMLQKWNTEYEEDKKLVSQLFEKLPSADIDYSKFKFKKLEYELNGLYKTHTEIKTLIEKYKTAYEWDDEQRRQHREDLRSSRNKIT